MYEQRDAQTTPEVTFLWSLFFYNLCMSREMQRKGGITVNNKSNLLEDIYAYYWSNVKSNLFLGMIIVPLSYIFALVVFFTLVLGKKSIPKLAILVLACFWCENPHKYGL